MVVLVDPSDFTTNALGLDWPVQTGQRIDVFGRGISAQGALFDVVVGIFVWPHGSPNSLARLLRYRLP